MRSAVGRITLKIIELLGCLACFLAKIITDLEARRVFIRNQKYSREWGLIHNVTWSRAGNTFANVTYGGFTLITTLMLISRCIDAKSRPPLTEKIFLTVGMLCFFAMGGIVLAAFDQVPEELRDNSLILGGLSFFVAFVMLFDLADPMARLVTDTTQTEQNYLESNTGQHHQTDQTDLSVAITTSSNPPTSDQRTTNSSNNKQTQSTNQVSIDTNRQHYETQLSHQSSPDLDDLTKNGNYHRSENIDFVQTQQLPQVQQPVFERVLMPEKKRPTVKKGLNAKENSSNRHIQSNTSPVLYSQHEDFTDDSYHTVKHYQQTSHNGHHIRPQSSMQQRHNQITSSSTHKQKPYQNFGYDESADEIPPPRYVIRSNGATVQNRYRDYEDGGPPLLVIRDYSKSIPTSTYVDSYSTKNQNVSNSRENRPSKKQHITTNRKNECCDNDGNKAHYNPIKPGFVANAAKMWDRRAAHQTGQLNTIV